MVLIIEGHLEDILAKSEMHLAHELVPELALLEVLQDVADGLFEFDELGVVEQAKLDELGSVVCVLVAGVRVAS